MPLPPDTLFERRWVIEGPTRKGGSSIVYKAADTLGQVDVAIKILESADGSDHDRLRDFWTRETKSLGDIKHPNIIRLLDSGYSEAAASFYLVFPWYEKSLKGEMEANRFPPDWHTYFTVIARPLLSAISLLHERNVVHRDIKPSNILLSEDGLPILADFGISKIKRELLSGTTLSQFGSEPWCPPERDSGATPTTRDIYGFGVLTASMLCRSTPRTYAEVDDMSRRVESKGIGSPLVRTMLASCCNRDPEKRPKSAQMLLAAVIKEEEKYLTAGGGRVAHAFKMSPKFADSVIADNSDIKDTLSVGKFIEEDLGENPHIERAENTKEPSRPLIGLIGRHNIYLADVDNADGAYLYIFATRMRNMPAHVYEQHRAESFNPKAVFRHKLVIPSIERVGKARDLAETIRSLDDHEQNRFEARRRINKKKLLQTWQHILEAQNSLLDGPISFERCPDNQSSGIRLKVSRHAGDRNGPKTISEAIVGQIRTVNPTSDGALVQIRILEMDGDDLVCSLETGSETDIPNHGRLLSNTGAQEAALTRQRIALDRVRSGSSVRSDLADLLADPRLAQRPHDCGEIIFSNPDLDDDKKECVRRALVAKDFLIVHGPPGTGKTTFIRELVSQVLKLDPNARILLSSQTHVALDHALEGIVKLEGLAENPERIVRIVSRMRPRNLSSNGIRSLEETVEAWKTKTNERSRLNISGQLVGAGISKEDAEKIISIRMTIGDCRQAIDRERQAMASAVKVKGYLPDWKEDIPISEFKEHEKFDDAQQDYSEHRNLLKEAKEIRRSAFERAKLTGINGAKDLPELFGILEMQLKAYLQKSPQQNRLVGLLDLWDQWSQRLARSDEFGHEVLGQASVVAGTCVGLLGVADIRELMFDVVIIDEASKANPTEALIPMTLGRKWILVGDERQLPPYVGDLKDDPDVLEAFGITRTDLETTLFSHLGNGLHADCRVGLSTQHRMLEPIGELISKCFYDGLLKSKRQWDKSSWQFSDIWSPVTWIDTSSRINNDEARGDGTSFLNSCEVGIIIDLLKTIDLKCANVQRKQSVLVLSGYSAQVARIADLVGTIKKHLINISVEVNTIDSAQGRESDICIFSCVRSNQRLQYGFLREMRRVNVALSRARDLLIIVGNADFHEKTDDRNPLRSVLQHIESSDNGCKIVKS